MRKIEAGMDADRSMTGRIGRIFDCFGPGDRSLSVREIARRSSLPPATASRIINDLMDEKFLTKTSDNRVTLGMRLFELGQLVPLHRTLREIALSYMEDLREASHQTVHLAILDGSEVLYVAILGARGPKLPSRVGGRMPPNCTGVGKAILAFSHSKIVDELLSQALVAKTSRSIVDPAAFKLELLKIKQRGVAFDHEESGVGVTCVAAPIMRGDYAVAGLSITGNTNKLNPELFESAVRTVARSISRSLAEIPTPTFARLDQQI